MKEYEENVRELYNSVSDPWENDSPWYMYTKERLFSFIENNCENIFNENTLILNAGSGGTEYNIDGVFYHADLAENLIKDKARSHVCSIEEMPFDDNYFDVVICVGSVINYCNALTALNEIQRVMKPGSYLILEYERSQTGGLIMQKEYGKSSVIQIYEYNSQPNHKLWLYSDFYIENILSDFEILKSEYFHTLSSIAARFINNESKSGKLGKYDRAVPFLQKSFAHDRIILCKLNP
jgi:SAM-dependent methyltransferase